MKDLIAKLKSEANVALGAIWLHIDAQSARIAELESEVTRLSASWRGDATVADALEEHIAELEAQIADWAGLVGGKDGEIYSLRQQVAVASAHQAADTDKLREAMTAWESLRADVLHGPDGLDNDQVNIILGMIDYYTPTASTALQAPVREVPDNTHKLITSTSLIDLRGDLAVAAALGESITLSPESMKAILHAMRTGYPLPAAPVQQEGE